MVSMEGHIDALEIFDESREKVYPNFDIFFGLIKGCIIPPSDTNIPGYVLGERGLDLQEPPGPFHGDCVLPKVAFDLHDCEDKSVVNLFLGRLFIDYLCDGF